MVKAIGYAAYGPREPLKRFEFDRREPGDKDVVLEILYAGVCHSDLHQVRNEWGGSRFPMVPGHEIAGRITHAGKKVTKFKVGDAAGVGCMVDSCRRCENCKKGLQQYCQQECTWTYNSFERDGKTPTWGGYSNCIVVSEDFTIKISSKVPLDRAAPLLCAGITTYSPLRHWKVGQGMRVGIIGLGGLGHMATKIASALGTHVTVLSNSPGKESDAKKFGAKNFILTSDPNNFEKHQGQFDFLLNTVSASHKLEPYMELLKTGGQMVLVGASPDPLPVPPFSLIGGRKSLSGSLIGGIRETQEMMDFCTRKKIFPEIELIPMASINEAYERMLKSDVRYRFVINLATLK